MTPFLHVEHVEWVGWATLAPAVIFVRILSVRIRMGSCDCC